MGPRRRPTPADRRRRDGVIRPPTESCPALIIATVGLALLPGAALGATLADRATMRLQTSYLLKASLTYATSTIVVNERITLKNTSGSTISKLNLSVMPRAFSELVSIGSDSVDDTAVTNTMAAYGASRTYTAQFIRL